MIKKKLKLIKNLLLIINFYKITYGELCIYSEKGTVKFSNISTNDIYYAYSRVPFLFENPFNTFYGNCTDDKNVINIYGVPAKREVINKDITLKKRDKSELFDGYDLNENHRKCTLLTSINAEGNPYHEELTGKKNLNMIKGWKLKVISDRGIFKGNSQTMTFSISLEESYSISVSESYDKSSSYSIDTHSENIKSNNFSKSISDVIEEVISNSISNTEDTHWEDSIMNDITTVNEKHTEENRNHEEHEENSSGKSSTEENGTTENNGRNTNESNSSNEGSSFINTSGTGHSSSDTTSKSITNSNSNSSNNGTSKSINSGNSNTVIDGKSNSSGTGGSDAVTIGDSNVVTDGKSSSSTTGNSSSSTTGYSNSSTNGNSDSKNGGYNIAFTSGHSHSTTDGKDNIISGEASGKVFGIGASGGYSHGTSKSSSNEDNHSTTLDINYSSTHENNHSSTHEKNHSTTKEKNHSNTKETNHSSTHETNHSSTHETNFSIMREWNHSSTFETNHSSTTESNHSDTFESSHSSTDESNHSNTNEFNYSSTHETNKSKTRERSEGTTYDRGTSQNRTSGITRDHSTGKSDTTGYSEGKSDSISNSESFTKANGGSKAITNSTERSKTTGRTEDNTTSTEIGVTTGNSESKSTTESKGTSTTESETSSRSINYSFSENIYNNGDTACQIMFYKKVLRSTQITSCYDFDDNMEVTQNTRSLVYIDIDETYIDSIKKNELERILYNATDYQGLMVACQPNTVDYDFIPEENRLTKAFQEVKRSDGIVIDYVPYLMTGTRLKGNLEISDIPPNEKLQSRKVLKMQNNNLVFVNGDNRIYYNTETSNVCGSGCTAYLEISKLNHLEIKTDEDIFAPVGGKESYGKEFSDNFDNPELPYIGEIKNDPLDNPLTVIENTSDIRNNYIERLTKDEIDYKKLFEENEQMCKNILWYCSCQNENFVNDYKPKDKDGICEDNIKISDDEDDGKIYDYIYTFCMGSNYYYTEEDINNICNKDNQNNQSINIPVVNECTYYEVCVKEYTGWESVYKNIPENENCDDIIRKCRKQSNPQSEINSAIGNLVVDSNQKIIENNLEKEDTLQQQQIATNKNNLYDKSEELKNKLEYEITELTDVNNFKIVERKDYRGKVIQEGGVVLWSSVRPEHQNFIVGWNGNGASKFSENAFLVINSFTPYNPQSFDGFTLYDSVGIPIWSYRTDLKGINSTVLDPFGYYLPVKYGYPFIDENVTKEIPAVYLYDETKNYKEKNVPHLTLPNNIQYKGNELYYGGCNNVIESNQGLQSESGRFSLILQNNGNLVFKDNKVTIWESKTANLWQGKGPYKLIVGNDGIMRILNVFDYVLMSTINNPQTDNKHSIKQRNYRLQVLNAGTFRIVNENGEEVWNMWAHAKYHEFYIYNEHEFYNACNGKERNPNLPLITTYNSADSGDKFVLDNSIIRVGEQLINRFTPEQYKKLQIPSTYRNDNKEYIELNSERNNYIIDEYDNYYSTARLPLTSFHLKYQNVLQKVETVDYEKFDIGEKYFDLKPITDRNSKIVYGKLENDGTFNIYDGGNHMLFTTGIADEICKDNKKCFYFMYITPDEDGFVKIMKRSYNNGDYVDSLIWMFPPKKKLKKMISNDEKLFLQNLESLIYRNDKEIDKDCKNNKDELDKKLKKYLDEDKIDYNYLISKPEIYCKDTLRYCNCHNNDNRQECRKQNVILYDYRDKYNSLKKELEDNNICEHIKHNYTKDEIDLICRNYGDCTIINEFTCITLRTKGVYFYGDSQPFYAKNITANSKLYLEKDTGLLKLDGQDILDLDINNIKQPTKLSCVIDNDIYGIELVDSENTKIWEYPSRIYLSLNTDIKKYRQNNNTMIVDRSLFYLKEIDEKKNIYEKSKCLEFKSNGLYINNEKITNEFEEKGRTLYLDQNELYIESVEGTKIENSVIKLYNPEKHHVSLTCKSNDKAVIIDQVTENIIWSYPTQQFELISSDTKINQLRPYQELIYKGGSLGRFCLRINKSYFESIETKPIIIPQINNIDIDYLEATENGVFIHYGDNTLNLLEAFDVHEKNDNESGKSVYSVKCEEIYGILKTSIWHNDKRVLTLPLYEKKYEISSNSYLYYGEKLYSEENENESCLTFDNNELFSTDGRSTYIIPVNHKDLYNDKNYIYMNDHSLLLNDNVENPIVTVQEISNDNLLIGKCMKYHGSIRFVLYSEKTKSVYMEFPSIEKKSVLTGDDIIYDTLYIDDGSNDFSSPCIRIDVLKDENGNVITGENGKERVGLFFSTDTNPNKALTKDFVIYDEPNNNNFRFYQQEGILKFNNRNFLNKSFQSNNLSLKCEKCNKYDNKNNICAKILDSKGSELWRYPEIDKKEYISTDQSTLDPTTYKPDLEYLLVGEYLYKNEKECIYLSESGFVYEHNGTTKLHKINGKNFKSLQNIHLENDEKNKSFKIVLTSDGENNEDIIIKNKNNSSRAELRCDYEYGYYVIDNEQNRLKNMITKEYGPSTKQNPYRRYFTKSDSVTDTFYVGDKIVADDGTLCAEINDDFELVLGTNDKYKIPGSVYSMQLDKSNILSPLIINNNNIFEHIPEKYENNPPKSISLRCKKNNVDIFLALYDDDNDTVMDEKFTLCRKHKEYLSGELYNNELCEGDNWGLGYNTKCLILKKDNDYGVEKNTNKLVDFRGNIIKECDLNTKIKIDLKTGNLIETRGNVGTTDTILLKINNPNVKMFCNDNFDIIMSEIKENNANTENIIWKYRPKATDCENGLQSNSNNCHTIYKFETMEKFKINPICLGNKYNEDILQLSVKNNGSIIVNNNMDNVLVKDEWNRNKEHNYAIRCNNKNDNILPDLLTNNKDNSNCKFINDDTKEIIHVFKQDEFTIPKEYTMANTFALGEKIMCKSAGLVLTNEGFKYRYIKNGNKNEENFNGEMNIETKAMVGDLEISSGYFEIPSYNFNLKLKSKDSTSGNERHPTLVKYVNKFNNTSENKHVGITCRNGKLEFYEIFNNERKVYYEYPPITKNLKPSPIYPGDRCGLQYSNQKCKNSDKPYCSNNGECVTSNDERSYMENGCQSEFNYSYTRCRQYPTDSCGHQYGDKVCTNTDKPCCSDKGICVSSDDKRCYIEHGCQSTFNYIDQKCKQYPPDSCGPQFGDLKCQNPEKPYCNINTKTKKGECVSPIDRKRYYEKGCRSEYNYGNEICPNYPENSCGANFGHRRCKTSEKPCCNININDGECVSGDLCYIDKGCTPEYSISCIE